METIFSLHQCVYNSRSKGIIEVQHDVFIDTINKYIADLTNPFTWECGVVVDPTHQDVNTGSSIHIHLTNDVEAINPMSIQMALHRFEGVGELIRIDYDTTHDNVILISPHTMEMKDSVTLDMILTDPSKLLEGGVVETTTKRRRTMVTNRPLAMKTIDFELNFNIEHSYGVIAGLITFK